MALLVSLALYDCEQRHRHSQYPWPYDETETWRELRLVSVENTTQPVGSLRHIHAYLGLDENRDSRPDAPEVFALGDHEVSLRGIRTPPADWPAGKQWGVTNPGASLPWMDATRPPNAIRFRVFHLVLPLPLGIVSSGWIVDTSYSHGCSDGIQETTHLISAAAAEL